MSVDTAGRLQILPKVTEVLRGAVHEMLVFPLNRGVITVKPDPQEEGVFMVLCLDGQLCRYRLTDSPSLKIKEVLPSKYFNLELNDKFNKRFNLSLFIDRHPCLPLLVVVSTRSLESKEGGSTQQQYYASVYHLAASPDQTQTIYTPACDIAIQSIL